MNQSKNRGKGPRRTGQRIMAVWAAAATAALLAACSSSSKPSSSATSAATTSPSAAPTTAAPSANLSGKTFSVLGVWTSGEQAAFQNVLNGFQKQTGAHGVYTAAAGGT